MRALHSTHVLLLAFAEIIGCNAVPAEPPSPTTSQAPSLVVAAPAPRRLWIAPENGMSDVAPDVVIMIGSRGARVEATELKVLGEGISLVNATTGAIVPIATEVRGSDNAESVVDVKPLSPLATGAYRLEVGIGGDLPVAGASKAGGARVTSEFTVGSAPKVRVISLCGAIATLEFSEPVDIAGDASLDLGPVRCQVSPSAAPRTEKGGSTARRRYSWTCDKAIDKDITPLVPTLRSRKSTIVPSHRLAPISVGKLYEDNGCKHAFLL